MELSEAKEIVDYLRHHQLEHWIPEDVEWEEEMNIYKALDIFLDYLDNSISKDEVRKKIEELEENNLEIDFSWDSDDVIIAKRMDMGKLEGFKELLGE